MSEIPLGKSSQYPTRYSPDLLFPVARSEKRQELGLVSQLPFTGVDSWTAYELSWLNQKGKPQVAIGDLLFPADSPFLIESKSLKLYLNSLNQARFESGEAFAERVEADLSQACGAKVVVRLCSPPQFANMQLSEFEGTCIDALDVDIDDYQYNPQLLSVASHAKQTEERLMSHLLKSNCLITSQPDWASIQIHYCGKPIEHEGLLRYLISFRNHNEFHEQCVERIFTDIKRICQPEKLTVYARYTRRGGLDINPFRSDFEQFARGLRLARQ